MEVAVCSGTSIRCQLRGRFSKLAVPPLSVELRGVRDAPATAAPWMYPQGSRWELPGAWSEWEQL